MRTQALSPSQAEAALQGFERSLAPGLLLLGLDARLLGAAKGPSRRRRHTREEANPPVRWRAASMGATKLPPCF